MRCYHFSNMYLSSIQVGIQSAHAQMEMFVKYNPHNIDFNPETVDPVFQKSIKMLYKWAEHHKTMICLNAGFNSEMLNIKEILGSEENPYPWAAFYESEEAIGGLLTNIAIVLPEEVYSVKAKELDFASDPTGLLHAHLTDFDKDLIRMKEGYRMAK